MNDLVSITKMVAARSTLSMEAFSVRARVSVGIAALMVRRVVCLPLADLPDI